MKVPEHRASKYLERYIKDKPPDGCWLWQGPLSPKGYGKVQIGNSYFRAHRLAYDLAYKDLTSADLVLHKCDTPSCVNPAHLEKGTNADNMRQKALRGRAASGERHGMAKLSDEVRLEIYNVLMAGKQSMRAVAADYGVSLGCVSNIKYRSFQ